jgi:hypothetical protein
MKLSDNAKITKSKFSLHIHFNEGNAETKFFNSLKSRYSKVNAATELSPDDRRSAGRAGQGTLASFK